MQILKKVRLIGFMLCACAALTGTASLRSQSDKAQRKKADYPIVDYNAPEPSDLDKRACRREKGKKYDKSSNPVNPSPDRVSSYENIHFPFDITALPVAKSAAVIVGRITAAQAYLSPDKTGIYSEFDVLIEEVIKNDAQTPLNVGDSISVERPGGRLRIPTGQIQVYETNLNPLAVGCRYALFLVRVGGYFRVGTGYALEGGKVSPLDSLPIFERYLNASEESFLEELRKAASPAGSNQPPTNKPPSFAAAIAPGDPPEPGGGGGGSGDCQLPQTPPCTRPPADRPDRFIANKPVTVTYNPHDFNTAEIEAIRRSVLSWNGIGGVTFTGFPSTARQSIALTTKTTTLRL